MSMWQEDSEKLAQNLVQTLGPMRARHVALQYGWIEVAQHIKQSEGRAWPHADWPDDQPTLMARTNQSAPGRI